MGLITACPRWQLRHPESRKVLRPLQVAGRCLESETGCNGCWSWRRGLGKLLGRELTKYQYYSVPEDSYLSLFQQFSACFTNLEERNLKPTRCHRPQLDGLLQVSLAGKMLICWSGIQRTNHRHSMTWTERWLRHVETAAISCDFECFLTIWGDGTHFFDSDHFSIWLQLWVQIISSGWLPFEGEDIHAGWSWRRAIHHWSASGEHCVPWMNDDSPRVSTRGHCQKAVGNLVELLRL